MNREQGIVPLRRAHRFGVAFAVAAGLLWIAGCGGSTAGSGTHLSGTTQVVLLASSTANDQLTHYSVDFTGMTLTNKAGKQVTVVSTPVSAEFIHLNGTVEPLATVTIPQDVYVSATVTVPSVALGCAQQFPGTLQIDGLLGTSNATVNLSAPITVTGSTMGLVLNLQASPSTPFTGACPQNIAPIASVGPVFNLTGMQIAQTPTNSANGLALGLHGIVVSVGTSDLTVKALTSDNHPNPPVWKIAVDGSTGFQGVNGLSQIAAGVPVDTDAAIQADGSLVATRVAVIDSDATNISTLAGPSLYVSSAVPALDFYGSQWQGQWWAQQAQIYSLSNSTFSISGALSNLANLPFAATFNDSTMVPGQNIYITTHQASVPMGSNYAPASSLMLLPQTVNGTVTVVSTQGAFTAYTVSLASYNLFSNLAVQPGQTTRITNPDSMVVYVGSDTAMLNSGAVGVGETLRFNGLVFDDQGTLRMDCAQVSDGVTP